MIINIAGEKVELTWHVQTLVSASLDHNFGYELLCRGHKVETQEFVPVNKLISYLNSRPSIMLEVTKRQITDVFLKYDFILKSGVILINISGCIINNSFLFKSLWSSTLSKLSKQQRNALVLEICEDDINANQVITTLNFLRNEGFIIAMDDFGAGHSNLIRLRNSQFDIIKLDIKLIEQIPYDIWNSSYYRDIISLCNAKGALIVAEGIENKLQADFVQWAGVDILQGFLFSRPQAINCRAKDN